MNTARQTKMGIRDAGSWGLRPQHVDIVASLLMSILIVVGTMVLMLFIIWLLPSIPWGTAFGFPEIDKNGRGDHSSGFTHDIEPPGADEVDLLTEPSLAESLEMVTKAASSVVLSFHSLDTNAIRPSLNHNWLAMATTL